jgi:hypothetical protein
MGVGKARGIKAGRKLKYHRRDNRQVFLCNQTDGLINNITKL